MIISIASGKGGTGKTTVATNFALSLENAQLLDCDVEEPNAHIFIKPTIDCTEDVCIPVPEIDKDKCTACGRCKDVCVYKAIAVLGETVLTFHELCHGCGACAYACPEHAIREVNREIGRVELGHHDNLEFIHGIMNIGEAMAPPVIRAVKSHIDSKKTVIIDAPPGTSCPVICAAKDTDFCILVTEPTPFGLHDLKLAVEVVRKLAIPHGVVINRATLGDDETEKYCGSENIPVLMRIPFDKRIAKAYSQGDLIIEVIPELKDEFKNMHVMIDELVKSSMNNKERRS
ncbi:ATP-binding protein [Desulfosarcina sp.]|nr:ATP-binding protein [Desulfosarcina sp.]